VATILGFACGAATFWLRQHPKAAPEAAPPVRGIILRVEPAGRALHLSWNRNSETIRNATHARLYIEDGTHHSQLDLDPRELSVGTLTYWPETAVVKFRLEAVSADSTVAGAIQFAGGASQPQAAPAVAVVPRESPPKPPLPAVSVKRTPQRSPAGAASRVTLDQAKPSPFNPPPPPPKAIAAPAAREPAAPVVPEPPVKDAAARPVPPPAREPEPSVSMSAQPVAGSFLGRVVRKIPLIRRIKKPASFVPPKPVHQVRPVLTPDDRQSLTSEVPINVKVYITDSGKVDFAELLSRGSEGSRPFAVAAVSAARQWNFTPARLGEENVPGEVILRFDFRPAASERR